jgi:uncharacterized membrane protein
MPDIASFCAACGSAVAETTLFPGPTRKDGLLGALAYLTFLPALVLLLVEPHKRNRFIRFHSFQSIFLTIAAVAAGAALRLVFVALSVIPVLGHFVMLIIVMLASLGCPILWVVLLVKALQGEVFKLPYVGDLAQKQANLV